jgi:hypothetical protein
MPRRAAALLAVTAALGAVAGCGAADPPPVDEACLSSPDAIERALSRAPAPVTLRSGTKLSQCVARARTDADLQTAGLVLTRAADHLAGRAEQGDAHAALALGYLVGAARRGAAQTNGIHAELAHRVESAARLLADTGGPAVEGALERGLRAGQATG